MLRLVTQIANLVLKPKRDSRGRGMIKHRLSGRTFAREHLRTTSVTCSSVLHTLFVLLAILGLFVQTLVVQPHFHPSRAIVSAGILGPTSLTSANDHTGTAANRYSLPKPDGYSINQDPSNCPLCQEIAVSGQFVESATFLALLPFPVSDHFILLHQALPSFSRVSHIWQGRAPPQR